MLSNLRSVVAQCYRLGRRSSQTRNLSSSIEMEGVQGKVVNIANKLKKIEFLQWAAVGYVGVQIWETWGLINFYYSTERIIDELGLRKLPCEEQVAERNKLEEYLKNKRFRQFGFE